MKVTRQKLAQQLIKYLDHRIPLAELVDWAESVMMEGDFEEQNLEMLREIVGHIGLTDVRAFGMTWEDCEGFLSKLGYSVNVTVLENAAAA